MNTKQVYIGIIFFTAYVLIINSNGLSIPTLGMNLSSGILLVALMSFVTCSLMYIRHSLSPFEKHGLLFSIRTLHYFTLYMMVAYIFIFSSNYDWAYLILIIIILGHWLLIKNECILTYWESKLIDSDYIMGEDPYRNVFLKLIAGNHITWFMIVLTVFMFINAGFVVWRITSIPYIVKIVLVTVLALHQIYNNFQRIAVTP